MADVVEMAQDLIRIPSPTGREGRIAAFVRDVLTWAGFQARVNDHGTVVAILRRGAGPTLVFDAHLDTVEAEAFEWTHHPFAGEIADDKLYGRGASDMKGALAAMMAAGQALARSPIQGTLILTGTSWEEHFEGHTLGLALEGLIAQGLRPDAVIIGEASEMNIKRGQRGRTRIHVDIQGQAAHSAHPERGINAVYKASDLIQAIRAMSLPHDDLLGDGIAELIGIHSFPEPVDSVVPYACRVSYDLRLLPGQTRESVLAQFGQIISALGRQDPQFRAECGIASGILVTPSGARETVEAFPPAWKLEEGHPLVQTALRALRSIGQDPAITQYGFCTNGSYSAGVAGIPTIGYGPGSEDGAHVVDEHIRVDDLLAAYEGYLAIGKALLSAPHGGILDDHS